MSTIQIILALAAIAIPNAITLLKWRWEAKTKNMTAQVDAAVSRADKRDAVPTVASNSKKGRPLLVLSLPIAINLGVLWYVAARPTPPDRVGIAIMMLAIVGSALLVLLAFMFLVADQAAKMRLDIHRSAMEMGLAQYKHITDYMLDASYMSTMNRIYKMGEAESGEGVRPPVEPT